MAPGNIDSILISDSLLYFFAFRFSIFDFRFSIFDFSLYSGPRDDRVDRPSHRKVATSCDGCGYYAYYA